VFDGAGDETKHFRRARTHADDLPDGVLRKKSV